MEILKLDKVSLKTLKVFLKSKDVKDLGIFALLFLSFLVIVLFVPLFLLSFADLQKGSALNEAAKAPQFPISWDFIEVIIILFFGINLLTFGLYVIGEKLIRDTNIYEIKKSNWLLCLSVGTSIFFVYLLAGTTDSNQFQILVAIISVTVILLQFVVPRIRKD